jgi:hypothetical protein
MALSYTWGPPEPAHKIYVNDEAFFIRQNLYDFLLIAQQGFQETNIWIDQLCIDQDNVEERNHQVRLMDRIFRGADSVIAWLGPSSNDSDHIMTFIAALPEKGCHSTQTYLASDWTHGQVTVWKHGRTRAATTALFARSYWSRLWIVQEVLLGRKVRFLCGEKSVGWKEMEEFVKVQYDTRGIRSIGRFAPVLFLSGELAYLGDDFSAAGSMFKDQWRFIDNDFGRLQFYVCLYCHFNCFDPRDKIYGLVGLASLGNKNAGMPRVNIDYHRTTQEILRDFLVASLPVESDLQRGDWYRFGRRLSKQMGIDTDEAVKDMWVLFKEGLTDRNFAPPSHPAESSLAQQTDSIVTKIRSQSIQLPSTFGKPMLSGRLSTKYMVIHLPQAQS